MKLESKLGLSTGVLVLAMLVSASVAHIRIQEANRLSDVFTNERAPIISLTRDVRVAPLMSVRSLESYLLFGAADPALSARFRKERRDHLANGDVAHAKLMVLIQKLGPVPEAGQIQQFDTLLAQLRGLEDEDEGLNELHTPAGAAQARDLLRQQILPLDFTLLASLNGFFKSQENQRDAELISLQQSNHAVLITLWTVTILGALIGGILSFLLARRITRSIGLLVDRADAIASGDLTGPELDIHSSDQIGSLARAMQQMQSGLRSIIGTVAHNAGSLTASAGSMSTATDHIHRRVDQQAHQTQQAATAMQEMSASIAEVSRHTQSAAQTARSAAQTAHEGDAIVKQMLASMHSIATAVNDTSAAIGLLGEDSRRISQIVTVIDEIARKTNLLALNAAIEAARAGEQGRGFAVVAGEVRRLAESTAQATGEISAMIQGIQNRTRTAIASMTSGTLTVEQGVVTTNQAGEALERIIEMAERVDRMIAQIAIAASQQAASADQSSSSLHSIHDLSSENLTEMATTTAGIEGLRATAAALERQVDRFRIHAPQPTFEARRASPARRALPHHTIAEPARLP
jgi:methyl-accepting chemotaxis protein